MAQLIFRATAECSSCMSASETSSAARAEGCSSGSDGHLSVSVHRAFIWGYDPLAVDNLNSIIHSKIFMSAKDRIYRINMRTARRSSMRDIYCFFLLLLFAPPRPPQDVDFRTRAFN
uniref:Uncharacterized protein n=1 Tax=Anguilla anguilla TaxID=7936 RepID=A0A0E9W716_ANGAN